MTRAKRLEKVINARNARVIIIFRANVSQPVGCDMMLGSNAKEDACRECGGDSSDCNTVRGLFDADDLQVGESSGRRTQSAVKSDRI
jgi:hypothetical protein